MQIVNQLLPLEAGSSTAIPFPQGWVKNEHLGELGGVSFGGRCRWRATWIIYTWPAPVPEGSKERISERMNKIDTIFTLMDNWRHLPSYQLERRADLFFALYIPQALEEKLGFPIHPQLIPEFPARIGTIYPERNTNKSFKIDYLGFSEDGHKAVFVELKTDTSSRRPEQDGYLKAARKAGLPNLLEGVLEIFRATSAKRKYFYLIDQLATLEQYQIPDGMRKIMSGKDLRGIAEASRGVAITSVVSDCSVTYIQPHGSGPEIISFEDLWKTVQRHDDEISSRFATSLSEWAQVEA